MNNVRYIAIISGLIVVLIALVYSGWVIQAQDRRWHDFDTYVRARDARWEAYVDRTNNGLHEVLERLARIEAKR